MDSALRHFGQRSTAIEHFLIRRRKAKVPIGKPLKPSYIVWVLNRFNTMYCLVGPGYGFIYGCDRNAR